MQRRLNLALLLGVCFLGTSIGNASLLGTSAAVQHHFPSQGAVPPFPGYSDVVDVVAGDADAVRLIYPGPPDYQVNVEAAGVFLTFRSPSTTVFDASGTFNGLFIQVLDWRGSNRRISNATFDTNLSVEYLNSPFPLSNFSFTENSISVNFDAGDRGIKFSDASYFNVLLEFSGPVVPDSGATLILLTLSLGFLCVVNSVESARKRPFSR